MDTTKKSVNLKVDPDVWQEAKVEAIRQGVKLRDYVTAALRIKLDQDKNGNKEKY